MNLFGAIRQKIGYQSVRKKLKNITRERKVFNLNSARNVGLVFKVNEKEEYLQARQFLEYLSDRKLKVVGLGYFTSKNKPSFLMTDHSINTFSDEDMDYFYRPKKQIITKFINEDFDILINMDLQHHFALEYVGLLSRAKFKVARYNNNHEDQGYDLMIDVGQKNELDYFINNVKHYLSVINNS